jgi:hypothetical protein
MGAAPLVLLVFLGLDALRYAVLGPSPFERSIEIDVLYIADFNRLIAWAAAAILTVLLSLGNAHATTATKRWLWKIEVAALPILLALAHWHGGAVLALLR